MRAHDQVTRLTEQDFHAAVAAVSRAFWPDPMFGFFARNGVHEHTMLPFYISAIMEDALEHGEVDAIVRNGRIAATASWLTPGDAQRTRWRETVIRLRVSRALVKGRNRFKAMRMLGDIAKVHPEEPHWYLALIGVDPKFQGSGIGTALLNQRLALCDETDMPAYLETQKPENVPYYERFGFTVRNTVEHKGCPTLWTMWREPRHN